MATTAPIQRGASQSSAASDSTGLGPSNPQRFQRLREVRAVRRAEETTLAGLQNKVSLLRKEEQRVLHKIMCIGGLKQRIGEVARRNRAHCREMQSKKAREFEELQQQRQRNCQARTEHQAAMACVSHGHLQHLRELKAYARLERQQRESVQALKAEQLAQRVQRAALQNRLNHEIAFQVRDWEAEAVVRRRLDGSLRQEEARVERARSLNGLWRERREAERQQLRHEQLVQEHLFEDLKAAILKAEP